MMKRLLDEERLQGSDAQLAELLRSATPFEVDPFGKRRVLVGIERKVFALSRNRRLWLRPAVALTLLISGTATAAIGHHYASPGTGFFGLSVAGSTTATKPSGGFTPLPRGRGASPPEVTAVESGAAPDPAPSAAPSMSAAPAPKLSTRVRPESAEDASNVVEAIQALRTGRDPTRAQSLLDDYLKTHPRGVLSGDALALSIEAASARNDPRAADYAHRYLALYPKGKYRDLAKRALEKH